ncbi:MAG: DUF3099 domain-containing protein [Leucobacter sp.]
MSRMNGASPSYSVTSAGVNPADDRAYRMRMYFVAMTLRLLCVASLFWVRGWWIAIPVVGSILLPWFAVMIGNAVQHGGAEEHDVPEPLQLHGIPNETATTDLPEETVLVVDVDPVRRGTESSASEASTKSPIAPSKGELDG